MCVYRYSYARHCLAQLLYGMGEALNVRVGYHLGHKSIGGAKRVCVVAFFCANALSLLLAIVLTCCHNYVGRIFSDDPAVVEMMGKVIQLVSFSTLLFT